VDQTRTSEGLFGRPEILIGRDGDRLAIRTEHHGSVMVAASCCEPQRAELAAMVTLACMIEDEGFLTARLDAAR
jgi:hypothetical protein